MDGEVEHIAYLLERIAENEARYGSVTLSVDDANLIRKMAIDLNELEKEASHWKDCYWKLFYEVNEP